MIRIKIYAVGKTKDNWVHSACELYAKRLQKWAQIELKCFRTDQELIHSLPHKTQVFGLDPLGALYTSKDFAHFVDQECEKGGARLHFVIGGCQGLPPQISQQFPLISLSPLVFTHQLVRVVFYEQLYRAFTIIHGIPYHK